MGEFSEHILERRARLERLNSRLEIFFARKWRARIAFACLLIFAVGLSLILSNLGWLPR